MTNSPIPTSGSSGSNITAHQNTPDCIFCKIVNGDAPSHKVWESNTHLAFLSIFPNTKGVTVVIPKKHYNSYAFEIPEEALIALTKATKQVALLLDEKLSVGRTALVLEGFGVDHVHAKLFPMHGTSKETSWKPITSPSEKKLEYFDTYKGYISSHDGIRADDAELAKIAQLIRS